MFDYLHATEDFACFLTDDFDLVRSDAEKELVTGRQGPRERQNNWPSGYSEQDFHSTPLPRFYGSFEKIHLWLPEKPCNKLIYWFLVEFDRFSNLLNHSIIHYHNTFRQRHCFHLIMRYENHGRTDCGVEPCNLNPHLDAKLRIKI